MKSPLSKPEVTKRSYNSPEYPQYLIISRLLFMLTWRFTLTSRSRRYGILTIENCLFDFYVRALRLQALHVHVKLVCTIFNNKRGDIYSHIDSSNASIFLITLSRCTEHAFDTQDTCEYITLHYSLPADNVCDNDRVAMQVTAQKHVH